jgi:DNA-binding transcriptional ArsR family regulator
MQLENVTLYIFILPNVSYNTFRFMNMKKQSISQISEQIASLLTAIAAPQRIAILLAIGTGEACVCHLEAKLGYRQAYISQHLMALRQAGLLDSRREGKYIFYRLAKPEVTLLIQQAAKISGVNLPVMKLSARTNNAVAQIVRLK